MMSRWQAGETSIQYLEKARSHAKDHLVAIDFLKAAVPLLEQLPEIGVHDALPALIDKLSHVEFDAVIVGLRQFVYSRWSSDEVPEPLQNLLNRKRWQVTAVKLLP